MSSSGTCIIPGFKEKFGPRGVMCCTATTTDDTTVDPAYGKVGKQKIENTGPLKQVLVSEEIAVCHPRERLEETAAIDN
jgi:hypothetical protein